MDLFLARHIDEEATLREHRDNADAALRAARRQVPSAEREVMRAEERLARLKDRWRDGEIDTELWKSESAELGQTMLLPSQRRSSSCRGLPKLRPTALSLMLCPSSSGRSTSCGTRRLPTP
jgi:hypothetical protein